MKMKYRVSASRNEYLQTTVETQKAAVDLATEYVMAGYNSVTVTYDDYEGDEDY